MGRLDLNQRSVSAKSLEQTANCALIATKLFPEPIKRPTFVSEFDDQLALFICEVNAQIIPSLVVFVPHIVRVRTKKQMSRVHTCTIVAVVQYVEAVLVTIVVVPALLHQRLSETFKVGRNFPTGVFYGDNKLKFLVIESKLFFSKLHFLASGAFGASVPHDTPGGYTNR